VSLVCLVLSEGPGMLNGGQRMRAFRPSRFTPNDSFDEELEQAKEANLQRYAARAEAGLPLFDVPTIAEAMNSPAVGRMRATGS